ncbi:Salicylate 1-monooxygenase [Defluviimonas sp. 20V17]|uniref:2-polyprenyl-6-methoxyphenol hydroxylase n=1 Tax=Allgaiera indica TaxID=765699 RepID=A0AAN4UPX0_9RHOB|nr:flavin-dependent oxidoreductase [Allgaiera indica]KDB03271.1 Salicylate 1-monooxygenase [Defluviimonas sp. 20V17]GHE00570.1 salicylate 1-monooxygenase [Allgaiera indica]SDW59576.1 2-polyprenyl-6-methoxyphenol hydroxylase [Allgaiera indica]
MTILIAGAGIGGLTTALMLHARGIRAQVVEQAPQIREIGVGINTLPHSIAELAELGLLKELDKIGLRTRELRYLTRNGQEVWRELRGLHAGHAHPQFSIHRGRLQMVLYKAVEERLGPGAVLTGHRLTGFVQDEGGVTAQFTDTSDGLSSRTLRGEVLICADGIHSVGRRRFYPDEGRPSWAGVVMWRGATDWPVWEDGQTMAIAGGLGAKLVLYPIAPARDGRQLMNWVVNVRIADGATQPPPEDNWSRRAPLARVLPYARRFTVPGMDIEALVRASGEIFEYPMADRDPLPRWTHGRVTLLGDAAHPMYPVGSNGAAQAILDARSLADNLARAEHPREALYRYEQERLPKTAEVVRTNRVGGPERVIDEVEKITVRPFKNIDKVLSYKKREAIVKGYAQMAGFATKKEAKRRKKA